jgi:hypothetical protein
MRNLIVIAALLFAALLRPAAASQLIESYTAFLGSADHFSSTGTRLTTAAQVVRQDRANFHKFGIRDPQDTYEPLFADVNQREYLEQMLERGHASPATLDRIVNSFVLIRVDVYADDDVYYVVVTLLD